MQTNKEERVLNYYVICNKLKDVIRTGWKTWNVKRERLESVAEHVFGVQMLAIAMKSEYSYDIDIMKVIFMLAIHELGETVIGVLTQFDISKEDKERIEHEAVSKILRGILDGKEIENLFLEFDSHSTKESMFAYMCDKLECDLQCKLYDEEGCVDLNKQDGNNTLNNKIVHDLLALGASWSEMWLKFGQQIYPYDDNFRSISSYAIAHKLEEKSINILIVEDDDYKYKNIVRDLKDIDENLAIFRLNNCMDALAYFRTLKNSDKKYDLLITDNYMPLRNDTFDLSPYANYIINTFRNKVSKETPICICSSDEVDDVCDYNYFALYEPTKSLQEDFTKIIGDINSKNNNLKEEKVLKYYILCNKLKNIIRTGWKKCGVKRERLESVAEHIYGVQMLAIAMKNEYGYDIDIMKVVFMLAVHELGETVIGDYDENDISKKEKERKEHEAVHIILKDILDGEIIEKLFLEFDSHSTKESMFAYMCDKLEGDLQCKLYDEEGCVDLSDLEGKHFRNPQRVAKLHNQGISWSQIWMQNSLNSYPYDDNFRSLSNYAQKHKIKK